MMKVFCVGIMILLLGQAANAEWPQPIIAASEENDLDPAQAWGTSIAQNVAQAKAGDAKAREAIVSSLYAWARVDAMSQVTGNARGIYSRRVSGPVMAWRAIRPWARQDWRSVTIDKWVYATGKRMRTLYGLGGGASGVVLNYNNNLQATSAMVAYAAGLIGQDSALRWWAVESSKEVLDQVDKDGFTIEVKRFNSEKAEYYSHETMIYLVATAVMADAIGNDAIWTYVGKGAAGARDPAMLRIGRLLDQDLGNSSRYAAKTGRAQIVYPNARFVAGLLLPSGYIECWFGKFLHRYTGLFVRLRAAERYYDTVPQQRFNPGIGGWMF